MPDHSRPGRVLSLGGDLSTVRVTARRTASALARRLHYTLPGASTAVLFACLSFTPSLLPRPIVFQAVVTGINGAIGYAVGLVLARVWREFADRGPKSASARSWWIFAVVAGLSGLTAIVIGQVWQYRIRDLMGMEQEGLGLVWVIPVLGFVLFFVLIEIARGVRWCYRRISRLLSRAMGERAARATGFVLLAGVLFTLVSGVLWDAIMTTADRTFAVSDLGTAASASEPANELRSGGPGSLIEWDDLGRQGRSFVGRGPDAEAIGDFTGSAAEDPIRIYAGSASADDVEERADLALRDLERAGGFERKNLLVVTTTGSGFVEPSSVNSFEYLTAGDSATVGIQYSHFPSWLSYLVDQEVARDAGRALFDAVYAKWADLPAEQRPNLYVFGESLGSFGGETAFSGEFDLASRTDGALFVGPPSFNKLYGEFVDDRAPRSPEIEPVYRDGRTVRFAADARGEIKPTEEPWDGTRILYLQQPSDPIVWWNTDLLLQRPDWLEEERGSDVLDEMQWIPFVTFWQVTADLPLGTEVPAGHGHVYRGEHVDAWAAILQPDGWNADKSAELREVVLSTLYR
ncbi:alpha/beta-hydrolase family protein [Nocardioidaceae bacterium SCSIO 66511]|nr:alpha/beta-hydrolase family protein [Nocardioidaceae bacterium SCSIO 66511]